MKDSHITLQIVDDCELIRTAFGSMPKKQLKMTVIAKFKDGINAISSYMKTKADIILMVLLSPTSLLSTKYLL